MSAPHTLDVSSLPDFEISSNAPLWWGQVFLAVIEGSMFCILIAMYFYYRLGAQIWPPSGIAVPDLLLPSLSLVLLLLSCIGAYLASEAAKKDDRGGMLRGLILNIVLAAGAMALRAVVWGGWNFKWTAGVYGSITWGILFLHTLDTIADLVYTITLIVLVARGHTGPKQRLGVHVDTIVWYFLVAIWIPLYLTVYWTPRFWSIGR